MSYETKPMPLTGQWQEQLGPEFQEPYMAALRAFLSAEKGLHKTIYPHSRNIFKAFELTPFESVKVVILGQDPYHGPNQAQGLSFSVSPQQAMPPSLQNIYKELKTDLKITPPHNGCLEFWAKQGVLLLNSVLTVEQGSPGSHRNRGWEQFTDQVIMKLNEAGPATVFLLWGAYAHKKGQLVDAAKHKILKAAHPSPFAAHKGFFGTRPFSQANQFLLDQGKTPIQWGEPSVNA